MEVKPNLTKDQMPEPGSEEHLEMKDIPYRNLLGSLNYISEITRGDIQGAVSVLARFACNPAMVHWKALKRILIYLYHSRHRRLVYGRYRNQFSLDDTNCTPIQIYVDADHGGCMDTGRSTSGTIVTFFGDTIHCKAKRQGKVSNSTAMAEIHALASGSRHHDAYRTLAMELLEFYQNVIRTKTDSQTVIKMLEKDALNARTKHLRLSFKELKELLIQDLISVEHIPGLENPSDICTKCLPRGLHEKHTNFIFNDVGTEELVWKHG